MTAIERERDLTAELWDRIRQIPLGPAEGWLTYGLVTLLAMTVAWSLDDAAWVLGNPDYGDYYVWAAILGVLVAFIGAKARWPRWMSHLFGAVVAALVLPVFVGLVLVPGGASIPELYHATSTSAVNAWIDLVILQRALTPEIGHHILIISAIVWSVGQYAGYAVFGHRRPLDAVIVVGIVLIGNMALTVHDQLSALVIFSIAALGLLARTHAFEEQATWIRRHIGDATSVRSLYLRGGIGFIAIAVAGSLVLTAEASSKPLEGVFSGFSQKLVDVGQALQRYLPFGGASRNIGFGFGPAAQIQGYWSTSNALAVTVRVQPTEKEHPYWRAVAYDHFELNAWTQTPTHGEDVNAGDEVLLGQEDDPDGLGNRRELTYSVTPEQFQAGYVLAPADPATLSETVRVDVVGVDGYFASIQRSGSGDAPYSGVALVPIEGDKAGDRSEAALRAAGQDYPDEVKALYLQVPPNALGPYATQLLHDIQARAKSEAGGRAVTPYDLAKTMQFYLRTFDYQTDVRNLPCASVGVVECFAHFRKGYCQYYASTMAIMLRSVGIPTRLVQGFLPGSRDTKSGEETLLASNEHAWVEVYFPGFGWQMFDPTGGGVAQTIALPPGRAAQTEASKAPGPSLGINQPRRQEEGQDTGSGAGTTRPAGANATLLIATAVALLAAVLVLAFVAWRRGPRGEISAESAWRSLSRTAARFGFGPRPTQTVYEYVGALGEVLPTARPELQTVARAKVEVAYGRRELGSDRLHALREAQRRLRVALLRLAFRRRSPHRLRFRRPGRR